MKCKDFEACITDLLNGSLEEPEHREALEHALSCYLCDKLLYEQQRLELEMKALAAGEWSGQAPPELEQRLAAAFRAHAQSKFYSPGLLALLQALFTGNKKWKYATAAVSLALGLVLSWNLWKSLQPDPVETVAETHVMEPFKPLSMPQPSETAALEPASVEAPQLPVMRSIRPRSRNLQVQSRIEWITAEIATDFFMIPYVEPFRPNDQVRVVRIQVPYATLADFGFPVYSDQALKPVQADVMVGDDNIARAIRFIQQWRLPREQSQRLLKETTN